MQSSRIPPHLGRASAHSIVTAAVVEQLEQQQLTHSVPSRVSDHVCIRLVRLQRWLADKLLRERCIHRATMLHGVYASGAAAMGTYVRHSAMWARHRGGSAGGRHQPPPPPEAVGGTTDAGRPAAGSDGSPADVDPPQQHQQPQLSASSTLLAGAAAMDSREAPSSPRSSSGGGSWGFGPRMDALRACHGEQELHLRHFLCMKQLVRCSHAELAVHAFVMAAHYLVVLLLCAVSPRTAHRLMGYALEESAVVLTHMVNDIDTLKVEDAAALPPEVLAYYTFVETAAPAIAGSAKTPPGTVPSARAYVAVSASVAPSALVSEGRSPDAVAAGAAAAAPRVACLRTLALLMRSEHISLSERHHVRADELDEKRCSAGSGSSFV
jgi:hypothetical protein